MVTLASAVASTSMYSFGPTLATRTSGASRSNRRVISRTATSTGASTCVVGAPSSNSTIVVRSKRSGAGTSATQLISTMTGSTYRPAASHDEPLSTANTVKPTTIPTLVSAETRQVMVSLASRSEVACRRRSYHHIAAAPAVVTT